MFGIGYAVQRRRGGSGQVCLDQMPTPGGAASLAVLVTVEAGLPVHMVVSTGLAKSQE